MADKGGILVIVEPGLEPTAGLRRAVAFARRMKQPLHLYLFEDSKQLDQFVAEPGQAASQRAAKLRQSYIEDRDAQLSKLAGELHSGDVQIETAVVWGSPVLSRILQTVVKLAPQLVIKDVHSEPLLKRILFTPLEWHLLRQCPAPLMLVKSSENPLPKRIVAAVDPLDERGKPHALNEQIIHAAQRLARQCEAVLDVVHVMEFSTPLYYPDPGIYDDIYEAHEEALKSLGLQFALPDKQLHLLEGETNSMLTEFVHSRQIDVLVMGTVQRSGWNRAMLGSTAEDILENIDCDILAVKPPEFSAALIAELQQSPVEAA